MFKLERFSYRVNCRIFRVESESDSNEEDRHIDKYIDCTISHLDDIIKLKDDLISQKLKESNLREFLMSFVCHSFPPYSPYVPYHEIHIENPNHSNINIISRNVFNIFLRASRFASNETMCTLGLSDPKFMLNFINLYGRNNENLVNVILKTSKNLNSRFVYEMLTVSKTLFQVLSDLYYYLKNFIKVFDGFNDKKFQFTIETPLLADRATGTDYSCLFVNTEHLMLDVVSLLEIVFKYTPVGTYGNLLDIDIETPHGKSKIEQILTNGYYLLLYVHQIITETNEPIYEIKNFNKDYTTRFQICVYYRCRIFVIKILLMIVKYNITTSPSDSAEYTYNWLLLFMKAFELIGGDQYNIDRDLITQDFNEINFSMYVDEWYSVHKNWNQNEITQIKSLVSNTKESTMDPNILLAPNEKTFFSKIKEVTQIEDEDTIISCLEKHKNDVDSTIMDLVNNYSITSKPKGTEIDKKGVERLSISYIPTENKQAIMNYWDFLKESSEMYNDDNLEDDEIPLNVNLNLEDLSPSEDSENERPSQRSKNFYRNRQYHKAQYANHHRRDRHRKKMQSGMLN